VKVLIVICCYSCNFTFVPFTCHVRSKCQQIQCIFNFTTGPKYSSPVTGNKAFLVH